MNSFLKEEETSAEQTRSTVRSSHELSWLITFSCFSAFLQLQFHFKNEKSKIKELALL